LILQVLKKRKGKKKRKKKASQLISQSNISKKKKRIQGEPGIEKTSISSFISEQRRGKRKKEKIYSPLNYPLKEEHNIPTPQLEQKGRGKKKGGERGRWKL